MIFDDELREACLRDLYEALCEEGLEDPSTLTDRLRREGFEREYLEDRLLILCEQFFEGDITSWTFGKLALIYDNMLNESAEA